MTKKTEILRLMDDGLLASVVVSTSIVYYHLVFTYSSNKMSTVNKLYLSLSSLLFSRYLRSWLSRGVHQNRSDFNAAKLRLSIDVAPTVDAFHVRVRDGYSDFVTTASIIRIGDDRRVVEVNTRFSGFDFFQLRETFAVARRNG